MHILTYCITTNIMKDLHSRCFIFRNIRNSPTCKIECDIVSSAMLICYTNTRYVVLCGTGTCYVLNTSYVVLCHLFVKIL